VVSSVDAGVGVEESMSISSSVAASVRDVEISIMVFGGRGDESLFVWRIWLNGDLRASYMLLLSALLSDIFLPAT